MSLHHAFWPARLPLTVDAPKTSLWFNLEVSALRYPDKDALVFMGTAWTYRQVHEAALRLAVLLANMGVRKGDRVLLDMQNCPQLVMVFFAILRLDAVVVPVNPMNRAEELKHYITDSGARVALVTADLAGELARASGELPEGQGLRHLLVSHYTDTFDPEQTPAGWMPAAWSDWLLHRGPLPDLPGGQVHDWSECMNQEDDPAALDPVRAGPQDLALLPYTSGTTGLPKGCMHTHGSVMHNAVASGLWNSSHAAHVVLAVVPMFHITGMVSVLNAAVFQGATLVIMPRWHRELAGDLISRYRVTHWTNIPTMVVDLLASPRLQDFDLRSLVLIGGGGAAMPEAVARRLFDEFGLSYIEGYGLTETAAPSHSNPPQRPKRQCLGIPFMGVDARIVDPETLQPLPVGEAGEIVICGPQVFQGYWKQPEATAAAFFEMDGKRFFRTGDMGRMDEDGYFFMTDRLKRMINASGFKVWPAEVEALMFRHPAIQEACVIATRDAYRGESVKAVVVLREAHKGKVSEQDIMDWCRDNMAVYKVPRSVQFVEALPKSGSGKVMWRALQEAEMASQENEQD